MSQDERRQGLSNQVPKIYLALWSQLLWQVFDRNRVVCCPIAPLLAWISRKSDRWQKITQQRDYFSKLPHTRLSWLCSSIVCKINAVNQASPLLVLLIDSYSITQIWSQGQSKSTEYSPQSPAVQLVSELVAVLTPNRQAIWDAKSKILKVV